MSVCPQLSIKVEVDICKTCGLSPTDSGNCIQNDLGWYDDNTKLDLFVLCLDVSGITL